MSRPPGKIWCIAAVFAATGALALSGCTSNVDTSEPTTQTATATAQEEFVVEDVAEKTVTELPAGPLYWHVENFPALADAEAAAGPMSLAADVEGKVWLFTLGPKGTPMHGGSMVSEIGPLVDVSAPEYLLAVSHGVAAPGAKSGGTRIRHRGVLGAGGSVEPKDPARRERCRSRQDAGGGPPDHPMEVTSSGGEELHWLIMFVLDANKPFASEATFEWGGCRFQQFGYEASATATGTAPTAAAPIAAAIRRIRIALRTLLHELTSP